MGTDVVLGVDAIGAKPFTYKWFFNGKLIEGEAQKTISLSDIRENQKELHEVDMNQLSSARSEAYLNVNQGPKFTIQPVDQSVNEGSKVSFNVAVSGSKPIAFQWYFNGEAIEGKLKQF